MLEWRLHPVAHYRRPKSTGTYEVFSAAALALATGATPPAPLGELWDGLEAFAAYGDDLEPQPLARAATAALGIEPDACGLVDHEPIADGVGANQRGGLHRRRPVTPARRPRRIGPNGRPVPPGAGGAALAPIRLQPVVQVDLAENPAKPGQPVDDGRRSTSPDGPGLGTWSWARRVRL